MNEREILIIFGGIIAMAIIIKLRRELFLLALMSVIGFGIFKYVYKNQAGIVPYLTKSKTHSIPISNQELLPDLTVKWVEKPAVQFPCKTRVNIDAWVCNSGHADAYDIEVVHNGSPSQYIKMLSPNHCKTLKFYPNLSILKNSPGIKSFGFLFTVDPRNSIREENESNNRSDQFFVECF